MITLDPISGRLAASVTVDTADENVIVSAAPGEPSPHSPTVAPLAALSWVATIASRRLQLPSSAAVSPVLLTTIVLPGCSMAAIAGAATIVAMTMPAMASAATRRT